MGRAKSKSAATVLRSNIPVSASGRHGYELSRVGDEDDTVEGLVSDHVVCFAVMAETSGRWRKI